MSDDSVFIGALGEHVMKKAAIKEAFSKEWFNVCPLQNLPGFNRKTFASWVDNLHCKHEVSKETLRLAQLYCVNYFLCPDSTDEFELEAYMQEIFKPTECPEPKVVLNIGRYKIIKEPKHEHQT